MLVVAGIEQSMEAGRSAIEKAIASGAGLDRFRRMIEAQGGDPKVVDDPGRLPSASKRADLVVERDGVVESIDTFAAGMAIVVLGGGRQKSDDIVDPGVGVDFLKKPGDRVAKGEPLAHYCYNDDTRYAESLRRMKAAIKVSDGPARVMPLVIEEIA
jgi:thymidine phosphorylase